MMDKQTAARAALIAAAQEDARRGEQRLAAQDALRAWHLVQIAAKSIDLATEQLTERGYGIYLPKLRTMVTPRAREVTRTQRKHRHLLAREKIEPLFPGYSFVRFNVELDPWHDIFKLVGVYGIHCANNMPKPMPDGFIAGLMAKEVNGAIPGDTPVHELPFRAGEIARMKDGPFVGFTGPIDRVDESGRISLMLTMLGSVRPVETTVEHLEKAVTPSVTG
jgi:transcription antitermination factor NusG